ncbi:MAG TPA: hypothetical protein VFO99_17360 [Pyrinomonadaceae bacterium]|nr:hypothetical protein [Pyrinomonadaceae bacterium]
MSKYACNDNDGTPADQPKPPVGGDKCKDIPETPPPCWEKPDPCPTDPDCGCPPGGPGSDPNCLEKMINEKAGKLAAADKDKAFKADLEALLTKANTATQDYTREKYEKLVKQWVEQDEQIVELIRKLVCALPCWRCVIECYVCPFINRMHDAEERLKWDPQNYPDAFNWYDLLNWHTRDKAVKERRFNRIKTVLAAWEKPAQTIEKVLTDNAKLIADSSKGIGSDAPKIAFDVFMKLVPMHLAIAPPKGKKWQTKIDKKYTEFCKCDTGSPDDCCGPDVGLIEWSLRQRLIGPQPYLIEPNQYLPLICCLVEERYGPAQTALNDAEAKVLLYETEIKRDQDIIQNGLKNFEKDAKGAIPSVVDCCDEELPKPEEQSQTS